MQSRACRKGRGEMKWLKSKGRIVAAVGLATMLVLSFGVSAFASSGTFGYTLPGYQENVTVRSGTRTSSSTGASVRIDQGGTKRLWLWCDAPKVNTRVTNSCLVTKNTRYTLSYWSRAKGNVYLRACTDGWQEPNYISGTVSF